MVGTVLFILKGKLLMIRLLSFFFTCVFLVVTIESAQAQTFWTAAGLQGDSVTSIVVAPNGDIFAAVASSNGQYPIPYIGVFRSEDNGNTWVMLKNPKNDQGGTISLGPVYGCTPNGKLFMGDVTGGGKSLASADDTGGNITQLYMTSQSSGTDPAITSVTLTPNGEVDAATGISGLLVSDDGGLNWTPNESVSFPNSDDYPATLACSPRGVLYAASATQLSRKNGPSSPWQSIGGSFGGFGNGVSFAFDKNDNIFAGGNNGLFNSTDKGNSWNPLSTPAASSSSYVLAVAANGTIFMSPNNFEGNESGVYVSTDNGADWVSTTDGLTNTFVNSFAINRAGIVFAATYGGVFKSVASTGGVKEISNKLPEAYLLEQNTPNPVNASTAIHFSIPEPSLVSINLYDVTGKKIAEIVNGFYSSGTFEATFDASHLPSGVYIYRMTAGGFTQTKSFVVLP